MPSRNYHPSPSSIVDIFLARNFPDRDFLPITRGAFYQRLSIVNSIKIRQTEMTASARVPDRLAVRRRTSMVQLIAVTRAVQSRVGRLKKRDETTK